MSEELISHSPDLKKLQDEGLQVEVRNGLLLVHRIPYLTSQHVIKYGILVSELTLAGNRTAKPETHVINFTGEYPCNKDGSPIKQIEHQNERKDLQEGITVDHSFSNKPPDGYKDYYDKVTSYISVISAPAKSLDSSVTEKTFHVLETHDDESIFNYVDTNSSRAEILHITSKLKGQKIAIIGLGGTGSYVLDFVAKTPVEEIHLFDGDKFLQHNAFRAPGAPSIQTLSEKKNKALYFKDVYSSMRQNIFVHDQFIDQENIANLSMMDFVFICIDNSAAKATIIAKLIEFEQSFIDVGMAIHEADGSLLGILRTTSSTKDARNHISKRISLSDAATDDYTTNIQIAELNALNASLAVVKWKKLCGFYQDCSKEHNSTYAINTGQLINEDET